MITLLKKFLQESFKHYNNNDIMILPYNACTYILHKHFIMHLIYFTIYI